VQLLLFARIDWIDRELFDTVAFILVRKQGFVVRLTQQGMLERYVGSLQQLFLKQVLSPLYNGLRLYTLFHPLRGSDAGKPVYASQVDVKLRSVTRYTHTAACEDYGVACWIFFCCVASIKQRLPRARRVGDQQATRRARVLM
jgi:hypothetical protein